MLNNTDFQLCLSAINQGNCILFLGPQFSMDNDGNKMFREIRKRMEGNSRFRDLDFGYDNLFIFKDKKPSSTNKMRLNMAIKNYYKTVQPHSIYSAFPQIPFSAIISLSPDLFIRDAFEADKINFKYFSHKGNFETKEVDEKLPILYNLFGSIEDENSLITTYDNFFNFFISVIGEEHKLPLELQNRLTEANFFVFIGFDLTKWYIPLLMHKLSNFKNSEDDAPTLVNNDNVRDGLNENQLPLELMILEEDTVPILNTLAKHFAENGTTNNLLLAKAEKEKIEKELAQLEEELIEDGESVYIDTLKRLEDYFEKVNLEKAFIKTIRGRFNRYKYNKRKGVITRDEADTESTIILDIILELITDVKNKIA